jgi:thymidylate synthase (FAD)
MAYDYNKSTAMIIGMTDTDEKVTAASGRISTQEGTALSIWDKSQDKEKNANLIGKVTASGHTSTVEHTYFQLAFQNVTAVVEQFIIEFRLASYTVKSRRYVNFSDAGFYVPEFNDAEIEKSYKEHMSKLFSLYDELCENGVLREDARFVLPYCLYSNFFCSVNGREFLNMLTAMICGRGARYPEIKKLGLELYEAAKEKAPGIMASFNPEKQVNDVPDLSFIAEKPEHTDAPVELLSFTPDAAKCVARNALISGANYSTEQIERIIADEDTTKKIVEAVVKCKRPRPLECVNYTFRFNNVSLSCITHFARHRIQSIEIPELIKTDRMSYIVPPVLKDKPELLAKYENAFKETAAEYERLKKLGIAEEILVYYQLSGNTLDIVTTMNARQLMLFMRLRSCTRAQWEIQEYAVDALKRLREIEPVIFNFYGPSCFVSACPEGRMTCGRALEIKKKFSDLK